MRVLVCGGRSFSDAWKLGSALGELHVMQPFSVLIHGTAQGADTLAAQWAHRNHITVEGYRPDWKRYGKSAGHIRNERMLTEGRPDLVVAFPGGRGTKNMIEQATNAGVRLLVIE